MPKWEKYVIIPPVILLIFLNILGSAAERALMDLIATPNQNILVSLISQTDWLSRVIMFSLCCISIVSVALFLISYYTARMALRHTKALRKQLESFASFDAFVSKAELFTPTFLSPLLAECLKIKSTCAQKISSETAAHIQKKLVISTEQFVQDVMLSTERFLPMLKLSAEMGPLMGLFGTVWGLIHAFGHIGAAKTVDIATIAPGIAEALLVTLTGLCVAIPMLVLYSLLNTLAKRLEHELYACAERLFVLVELFTNKQSIQEAIPEAQKLSAPENLHANTSQLITNS